MSAKTNILKLLTLLMVMSFIIVIPMNIFNSDQSFYYKNVMDHEALSQHFSGGDGYDDPFSEYRNQEPTDDQLFSKCEHILPDIPFAYMQRHKNRTMQMGSNCAVLPKLHTLRRYNNYWQTYTVSNVTMQLYAAYYDSRPEVRGGPKVRILAMINQFKGQFPTSYCHIWYENEDKPQIVAIKEYKSIWKYDGAKRFFPYLMTCPPPNSTTNGNENEKIRIPQAVALAEQRCVNSTNILKVVYNKPPATVQKFEFAICVKGMDFPYADISFRLVEWLELHRLLGVHKVFIYVIALHPNVRKVLSHYQAEGFVDLKPITVVGGLINYRFTRKKKRLNELIPYNDCFYRHMYEYEYIALVDVDEVIMPLGVLNTWHDIIEVFQSYNRTKRCPQGFAGLCFRNTYFPFDKSSFKVQTSNDTHVQVTPSAPNFMFMLNHQYRTSNYSKKGYGAKCLHSSAKTLTLHNHYSVEWLNSCRPFDFPAEQAHLQHYHDMKADENFNAVLADNALNRYKDELTKRTGGVLRQLGLLK